MKAAVPTFVALTFVVAGCGEEGQNAKSFEGEEKDVAAVVDDLQESARSGDAEKICDELFTDRFVGQLAVDRGRGCIDLVEERLSQPDATFRVERVQIADRVATARIEERGGRLSNLILSRENGDWRVDGIRAAKRR